MDQKVSQRSILRRWVQILLAVITGLSLISCSASSVQSRWIFIDEPYPERTQDSPVQIVLDSFPERSFVKISRLSVHLESTHFIVPKRETALRELEKQARQSGADAVIEVRERRWTIAETAVYHVNAVGIKYTD